MWGVKTRGRGMPVRRQMHCVSASDLVHALDALALSDLPQAHACGAHGVLLQERLVIMLSRFGECVMIMLFGCLSMSDTQQRTRGTTAGLNVSCQQLGFESR